MKKILLLFTILPLLMQSCLFEDKDYFEESASARVEGKISETKNVLSSASNGWILHYFPKLSYGGHTYALSFSNEQATISCETEVVGTVVTVGDPARVDTCLYDVIAEQGAILTFNTYSKLLHQFRNPSAVAYQGLGGDYEFILTDVKQDEIKLKGKTSGNVMRMFPVPGSYTKESYLEAVQAMSDKGKAGIYSLYYDGTLVDTVAGTQRGRYLSYTYSEINDQDTISTAATISLIYTPEGFIVYHDKTENVKRNVYPLKPSDELVDIFDPDKEYTEFIYNDVDKKFVSKDGKIEFVKIIIPINKQFAATTGQWILDPESSEKACAAFVSIYQDAYDANVAQWGEDLSLIYIGRSHSSSFPTPYLMAFYSDGYWSTYGIGITAVAGSTDQINIETSGAVNGNWPYYTYFLPIVDFFITNSPWQLIPDDPESPVSLKLVSVANSSLWTVIDLD